MAVKRQQPTYRCGECKYHYDRHEIGADGQPLCAGVGCTPKELILYIAVIAKISHDRDTVLGRYGKEKR